MARQSRTARTATERSRARFARAARVLGGITLDAGQAAALERVLDASGETAAQWVRRMIAEADRRKPR